jgi:hypothetical protein
MIPNVLKILMSWIALSETILWSEEINANRSKNETLMNKKEIKTKKAPVPLSMLDLVLENMKITIIGGWVSVYMFF